MFLWPKLLTFHQSKFHSYFAVFPLQFTLLIFSLYQVIGTDIIATQPFAPTSYYAIKRTLCCQT